MDDDSAAFAIERAERISANLQDRFLTEVARQFMEASVEARYSYNFEWLGRPIIQYPQDIVAMQELIWRVRPDLVIETGIARGGSLTMSASILTLLDYCEAARAGESLDPRVPRRRVLGIDVDIRLHNRVAIESHPLAARIEMLQGSSTDAAVISKVHEIASRYRRILVCLDSNHTDEHVFAELQAYAPLVSEGSYCVVFDTVIAELPQKLCSNRPWGPGDNPRTAIDRYLAVLGRRETRAVDGDLLLLVPDVAMDGKLVVTVAPHGYLQRIRATPGE